MSEQDDREAHNAELQERANAEEQADDAGLSPQDSWARVELWRWQYGTLPTPDDMRPLDVAYGMVQMAKALDLPMKRGADMPMPCNVAAVLRYAAKIIQAGNALYLNKGRVDGVDAGRVVCAGGASCKEHPAVFPVEIPRRLIKLYTYPGDVVLDPHNGAGATTQAASETGRKYIGIDANEEFCRVARRRVGSPNKVLSE